MIQNALLIVGPGGIGKGPLDYIIKENALRIEPYRLRSSGPRSANDNFYAHHKLRTELHLLCQALKVPICLLSPQVEWFPDAGILFFKVRSDWQLLILQGLNGNIAKIEFYAPIIPVVFGQPQIQKNFGQIDTVVLQPCKTKLSSMNDGWTQLSNETYVNCQERGDKVKSATQRKESIPIEAPAWKELIEQGATEYENWGFSEYKYIPEKKHDKELLNHQIKLLMQARTELIRKNNKLEIYFKTEEEIMAISDIVVKPKD